MATHFMPDGRCSRGVAACAGIIVFGSLMGAMFVGQQFLQDVLAYSTFDAGVAAAAKASFLSGDQWAYIAGIVAVVLGAALVFFAFPRKEDERRLLAEYQREDSSRRAHASRRDAWTRLIALVPRTARGGVKPEPKTG